MKNILYAQVGNAVQQGIYNALSKKMSLKDAIRDAQYMFKYTLAKKTKDKILDNLFLKIVSSQKKFFQKKIIKFQILILLSRIF